VEFGGTGELALSGSQSIADLRYRWVPRGIAWWRPQEELDVALRSVAAGLQSMQDICDERGFGDYLDNVAEIMREREQLAAMGFVQQTNAGAMIRLEPTT
jgi:capsid protein